MGTTEKNRQRIQYYSNPDVNYDGEATGTHNSNDVARKLEEEGCTVENFRPYDPPLSVYISGPYSGHNGDMLSWTANGLGGQTPYSYLWQYSLDGINYTDCGDNQSVNRKMPIDNDLFLKVIITDANQDHAVDYHYVKNLDVGGEEKSGELINEQFVTVDNSHNVVHSIQPNPAGSYVDLLVNLQMDDDIRIVVTDISGKVLIEHKSFEKAGSPLLRINTESLKNGIYIVKFSYGNNIETFKLLINK